MRKPLKQILLAGLGNPGSQYHQTRHNLGAILIELLSGQSLSSFKNHSKLNSLYLIENIDAVKVHYVFPQQFMNLSGQTLKQYCEYFKIPIQDRIICYDDLDLPCGSVKFKTSGGHGGHNGLRNCIEHFGTQSFPRLRLGIGHPGHKDLVHSYVLKPFTQEQAQAVEASLERVTSSKSLLIEKKWAKLQNTIKN